MPVTIEFKGLKEAQAMFKNIPVKLIEAINDELETGAVHIVTTAKKLAPMDIGHLASSISSYKVKDLEYQVSVNAFYAPYVEFGTGKYAASYVAGLPSDWQTYAAKFRGKNSSAGGADKFFENILRWVKAKGIRFESAATFKSGKRQGQNKLLTFEQTAYFIFHYILLNGIRPQPFLYPAFINHQPEIEAGIITAVRKLLPS